MTTKLLIFLSCCALLLVYLLMKIAFERKEQTLFEKEEFEDVTGFCQPLFERHRAFRSVREKDGFDRWAKDVKDKHQTQGFLVAAASVLVDGVTLGGTARKRLLREEYGEMSAIALRADEGFRRAENNIRLCVRVTGPRLRHGIRLLRKSQRMTRFVASADMFGGLSLKAKQRHGEMSLRRDRFIKNSSDFVAIATSAGAGAGTAIGLWGAVQLAGHASTGTAMAGLYGAAAHNAGWAWFGGGSIATGGGGMALGHLVLPGVGVAVALGTLSYQFHRQANDMDRSIKEGEQWLSKNLPVLESLMAVEHRYRTGSRRLRTELEIFDEVVCTAEKRLRRFGSLSDLRRRLRAKRGGAFYTESEGRVIEELGWANSRFLESLPDVQHGT